MADEAEEEYGVAHVTAHLRFAGRHDELFALVDEPEWRTRLRLRDPVPAGSWTA